MDFNNQEKTFDMNSVDLNLADTQFAIGCPNCHFSDASLIGNTNACNHPDGWLALWGTLCCKRWLPKAK
jgi:hypothetical protein